MFPLHCFDFEKRSIPMLRNFTIDDAITQRDKGAVEVTIELTNGEKRWCLFITPDALTNSGDWLLGTDVRFHYDIRHFIILNLLSKDAIEKLLHHIDGQGKIIECSLPLGME